MTLEQLEAYQQVEDYLPALGRVLIGAFFLFQGVTKVTGGPQGFISFVESLGIPAATAVAALVVLIEVLGGLALISGFKTRCTGIVLASYLVVVNLVAHQFWADPDQLSTFMKNVGIIGGLLVPGYSGSGDYSLDSYLE